MSRQKPKKAVVVLLDSLNRHMIGAYGGAEFSTPNLDRLAKRSVTFQKHFTGSLPCMPARHDILVGNMDFLWRPWGSIELWERPITYHLRRQDIVTMLFSDHPHLFEVGGENYHTDFFAWEYLRGHESDPWKTREDPSWLGTPAIPASNKTHAGRGTAPYDLSRTWFREELDYPGPKTLHAASRWLADHGDAHDSFLLFIDEFDPHEPFDTPEPWNQMYDPDWDEEALIWPPYTVDGVKNGVLTEREGRQVRSNYGSKLSMIDHWLGRLLDVMDQDNRWDDTLLILCTDHGHYLGEKDIWGKPRVPQYETLGHTPLMIAAPGVEACECDALTTNVDINATLVDIFDVEMTYRTHGVSLLPLLLKEKTSVRDYALGGVYGQWVQICDGRHKYIRAPEGDGFPLHMWSNRWSTMPIPSIPGLRLPNPDDRAYLDSMPGSDIPVICQPFQDGDLLPFWAMNPQVGDHHLYDLANDPDERENQLGMADEARMRALLQHALHEIDAPIEQLRRLGLG
ncbi:MAG: sulfatase [Pseudomonadales bacterium]|nr:sulfatase [Pseudomonadales bacterium]MBO6597424.1 sulfatase [Pseudomonadales bacterium]MBO6824158.1 sulfatase [Pseudomonadales bacterium]